MDLTKLKEDMGLLKVQVGTWDDAEGAAYLPPPSCATFSPHSPSSSLALSQLDAARKESEAHRQRAAAIEGVAASAMAAASPYRAGCLAGHGPGGGGGSVSRTRDEDEIMDTEVDDLLQQLQVCGLRSWIGGWKGVW